MPMFNAAFIRERIAAVAESEAELTVDAARDVAFHMTDWLSDLSAFVAFCEAPESHTAEQVNELLRAFLLHAPNHIAAAAKLYAGYPVSDIFGVGAVRESAAGV
ncbi:hypothetical protein [Niveibacterium sp. COAC-50]|uniref:hypothetical protein n=1 Tax=Niveibacterium sp. COAC-50 TaxID=2729384 RepID=UPI001553905B|nr:hypothetical protein [Niveibacterium sp. COAC-50]